MKKSVISNFGHSDILGLFGTFGDVLEQFGRLYDDFGKLRHFLGIIRVPDPRTDGRTGTLIDASKNQF